MIYLKKHFISHFSAQNLHNLNRLKEQEFIPNTEDFPPSFLCETKDAYYLKILVPGLEANHFTLKLKENQLIFEGKFKIGSCKFLHKERPSQEFLRKYTFTRCIDKNNIDAELKNGVLSLWLFKEESKEIEIIPSQHTKH